MIRASGSARSTDVRAGLFRLLGKLSELDVTVGIHRDDNFRYPGDDNLSTAEVMAVHEFGAGHVPQRSWLRQPVWRARDAIARQFLNAARSIAKGTPAHIAAGRVGEFAVGLIQRAIVSRIPPPNAPSTVARKGSSTPLIDTGAARRSIGWKLR